MCIGLTANPSGPMIHGDDGLYQTLSDAVNQSLFYAYGLHGFYWSSIQVNKNTVATPHRNKSNMGPSAIIFIGNFTGRELVLRCKLPKPQVSKSIAKSLPFQVVILG